MKTSTSFAAIEARSTYHGSFKKYFAGSRPNLSVPYREVSLATTRHSDRVAAARPMPLVPPVRSAIFPSSLPMFVSLAAGAALDVRLRSRQ